MGTLPLSELARIGIYTLRVPTLPSDDRLQPFLAIIEIDNPITLIAPIQKQPRHVFIPACFTPFTPSQTS